MKKVFKGIIAIGENRVIGLKDKLPWSKEFSDLKFFKEKTWGGKVIFGRKTFQGLGINWLPNREVYVLTNFNPFGWNVSECNFKVGKAVTKIVQVVDDLPNGEYWVAGGRKIYELFLPQMTEFYVTYIKGSFEGDTFMPEFESQFPHSEVVSDTANYKIVKYWR